MGKQRKEEIRAKRTEKSQRESEGWREEGREKDGRMMVVVEKEYESLFGAGMKFLRQENKSELENIQETIGNIGLETDLETRRRKLLCRLKIFWNQCGNKHPISVLC